MSILQKKLIKISTEKTPISFQKHLLLYNLLYYITIFYYEVSLDKSFPEFNSFILDGY